VRQIQEGESVSNTSRIDAYLEKVASGDGSEYRLNEQEVYGLLDILGITRGATAVLPIGSDEQADAAWAAAAADLAAGPGRLVLKILGRNLLHKTDVAGVQLLAGDLATDPRRLLEQARQMEKRLAEAGLENELEGILAAEFVPHDANRPGQEVLLSLRQDPAFGPCIVIGIGGTLTEWYGKGTGGGSTLILPAAGLDAATVRAACEGHPLLHLCCMPSRLYAEAPMSIDQLVDAVMGLAQLGIHCGPGGESPWTVEELEINPAVASAGRLTALDGVGLLSRRKWTATDRTVGRIKSLLAPRSAVVLGVSARSANPGRIILDNLLRSKGIDRERLWVIHAREASIAGVPCCADVASLPEKCDLAVVAVPAEGARDAIAELVAGDHVESIILIPGGFAEAGQSELAGSIEATLAQGHARPGGGPVMVGGNCLGIVSRDQYNTFFLPEYKLPFRPGHGENLAVVSQSGAYLVTFASNYDGLIHPRASISFGNQMDLTVSDFLEHFIGVPEVQVVACYVEGFRPGDGARFLDLARQARKRGQRVIIYKAGKTARGARAAASHTASLAGDYDVARACLLEAGVTVAETLDEFEDLLKTFCLLAGRRPGTGRTGIISNAGFECSTVMDNLGDLELAVFGAQTQAVLDEVLPGFAHRTNPIDCTPMTGTDAFVASCGAILASDEVDVAILSSVPVTPALDNLPATADGTHGEDLFAKGSQGSQMLQILGSCAKPVVVVVDSGTIYDPLCRMIEEAGVPVFRKIDRAARTLAAFCRAQGV